MFANISRTEGEHGPSLQPAAMITSFAAGASLVPNPLEHQLQHPGETHQPEGLPESLQLLFTALKRKWLLPPIIMAC